MPKLEEQAENPTRSPKPIDFSGGRQFPVWLSAALLGVATLVVYLPTLHNGFIQFDDPGYVLSNQQVRSGLTWSNIAWAFRSLEMCNWHPLAWLSHMADCQLFGVQPAGHHASSIVLHALNAVLLFFLLQKATGFPWRSLAVAALFALHPLNVETVAWVSERKSILSMFFSLLTVGLYGWYARAPDWRRYLAVMGGFALALLSKPMAVTLPVVLLLLDYWPLGRLWPGEEMPETGRRQLLRRMMEKLPLFLMSALSSWITLVAQKRGAAISSVQAVPLSYRLGNAAVSYLTYIRRMFWPNDLAYLYPLSVLSRWKIFMAVAGLFAITALVFRFRRHRHLVFGWLFFVVTLLPVIGIVQVGMQSMADRYAYIPLIGLFIAAVWGFSDAAVMLRIPSSAQAVAAVLLAGLAANGTRITEGYWRSDLTLFLRASEVLHPATLQNETNLAAALNEAGRPAEALVHFRNAESLAPRSFTAHYNCGYALARQGEDAAAVPEFQDAVRYSAGPAQKARAWNSLAIAYLNLGENQQAVKTCTELLSLQPDNAGARSLRGHALYAMHEYEAASRDFLWAAQINPAPELFLMAGKSLEEGGNLQQAIDSYRSALNLNPSDMEARKRMEALQKKRPGE